MNFNDPQNPGAPYCRTRIKICGLTCLEDAFAAVSLGTDALGFIFIAESPRCILPEKAAAISLKLPAFVARVGVFKDQEPDWIKKVVHLCGLHIVQLHGQESPEYCQSLGLDYIKAFRIKNEDSLEHLEKYQNLTRKKAFLLDTFVPHQSGGTGKTFDWRLAQMASGFAPIILSGGINPENVEKAIARVRPFAIDVASGIEVAPGRKDPAKMKAFVRQVHKADMKMQNAK